MFVVAHPDDECLFFGPSIQVFYFLIIYYLLFIICIDLLLILIQHMTKLGEVYLLCLSTGNYDGLGQIRKKELYDSCETLGIKRNNVKILDER